MAEGRISWKNVDNLSLGKAVANFNRKIKRIETEENKGYLPETLNFKDVKENITTRRELNRVIQNLRNFNKEGAEELYQNDAGEEMTRWEKDIIKDEISRGIRRLNKELRSVDKTKYPFETDIELNLKQRINNLKKFENLKGFDFKVLKERAFNIGRMDYEMNRAINYKNNYMKTLERYSHFDNYDLLIKELEKYKNPIRFFKLMKSKGELTEDLTYVSDEYYTQEEFNKFVLQFVDVDKMVDSEN